MPGRSLIATSLLLLASFDLAGQNSASLIVRADYAIVDLAELPASERYVQLPDLGFPLRIEPSCPLGAGIDTVSISVADTRNTFRGEVFGERPVMETIFRVPRQQIGPLPVEHFCTAKDPHAGRHILRIADVLTAQASLRCATESRQFVVYETVGLNVELRCDRSQAERNTRNPSRPL